MSDNQNQVAVKLAPTDSQKLDAVLEGLEGISREEFAAAWLRHGMNQCGIGEAGDSDVRLMTALAVCELRKVNQ